MNHRLITERERAESRRGRYRRKAWRQRCSRRERLLLRLHGDCGALLESELSSAEALLVLSGHGNSARRLVNRTIRSAFAAFGNLPAPNPETKLLRLDRPSRRLRRGRRGAVAAGFAEGKLVIPLPSAIEAAIESLRQAHATSIKEMVVLRSFSTATLLPLALAAEVLFGRGILLRKLSDAEISAAERVSQVCQHYEYGRRRFRAACTSEGLTRAAGDWAAFSPDDLSTLLPGLRIPILLRRSGYATNLVHENYELDLDVYSMPGLLPLFRHPLGRFKSMRAVNQENDGRSEL